MKAGVISIVRDQSNASSLRDNGNCLNNKDWLRMVVHIEPEMKGRILAFTLFKFTGEGTSATKAKT